MSKGLYFTTFICGALIGSLSTYYFIKDKYAKIAQEEIDSVKAIFKKRKKPDQNKTVKKEDGDIMNYYKAKVEEYGYADYSNTNKPKKTDVPYAISPDDYGEFEDYEQISLIYYSDGVLVDDNDEIVEDAEIIVGNDFYKHFGEYEDDSVFIRNDERCCDYEILRDVRPYSDIVSKEAW